jgi:putative endonuclease
MLDGEVLVFVEVRYRRQSRFGTPEETIQRTKQARLLRTARRFLQFHPAHADRRCRFDVIAMTGPDNAQSDRPEIRWLRDAFTE